MLILHIDIEGGFGGSSRSLAKLVGGLQNILPNYNSVVLCKANGPIEILYEKMGVQCEVFPHMFSRIPLPKYNFRNLLTAIPQLFSIIRLHKKIVSINPDVVHFNYAGLLFNGLLLKLSGYKGIIIIHSRVVWPDNFFGNVFNYLLTYATDKVVAIAEPVRQSHVHNGLPDNKVAIIHNPSNVAAAHSVNHDWQKPCTISYFGTIGNLKGPRRLIELADKLQELEFPYVINVFGAAPRRKSLTKKLDDELNSIIERQNSSDELYRFIYHGHVNDPEEQIAKSDFIVRPSLSNDPWGRDVIETMALGRVIVATGEFDGFVKNKQNGFLVGEWDVDTVAKVIIDTWKNPENYAHICKNAFDFAVVEFHPLTAAKKFVAILGALGVK